MYQLSTACICTAADTTGGNRDNLLFAGQILPEKNGGLNGTPALKPEAGQPFVAAVFTGLGAAPDDRKAAYAAAASMKNSTVAPGSDEMLLRMLDEAGAAVAAAVPGGSVAVMAAAVNENRVSLAGVGACHAYLVRDKALYLLSGTAVAAGSAGLPEAVSFTLNGKFRPGDQLLLCTADLTERIKGLELLKILTAETGPQEALQAVAGHIPTLQNGTITAILLHIEE